ncbi:MULTISPECIES: tetratricopeptide repeat protein [Sulfurimonas]|uniref:tetratricopeptide repeat protein n=1 Tax=Sulfurimonas TaxID=202746 RepID=UPI00125F7F83|nr:tetratricopeptide repeat protein [Sulfurimonas hydrogeniphila]
MRFIYILLFATVQLFASVFSDAVTLYKEENFVQAYEKFYILHVKEPENEKVILYLAKSLYNLGELQDAKKLFLILKKAEFKKEAQYYLKQIDRTKRLHKYFVLLSAGTTYDSNIRNNTYEPVTSYNSIILSNDTNAVSDIFIDKLVYFSHTYTMPDYPFTTWEDSVLLFHRNGLKYSDQNMLYTSLASGPAVHKNGYTLSPQILLNDLNYAARHYMYTYGLGVKLSKVFFQRLRTKMDIAFKKDKFVHDEDKTKNDNIALYKLFAMYNLTTQTAVKCTVAYQKIRKEFGNRTDISRDEYIFETGYSRTFIKKYAFAVDAKYEKRHFIDHDVSLGEREDRRKTYGTTVSRSFYKVYNLSLKYNYIKNESTISAFAYKKNTLSLMLSRYF